MVAGNAGWLVGIAWQDAQEAGRLIVQQVLSRIGFDSAIR
jgi:hypothetical protein